MNNPYESPESPDSPLQKNANGIAPSPSRPRSFWFKSFLVVACLFLVVGIILPVFSRATFARGAAQRMQCMNNFKQIQIALLDYEKKNGHFPPAYTVDADGNRLHSWRTLILPYLEEGALYESIDLTKPWDAPANKVARDRYVTPYFCPTTTQDNTKTTYMAITGPNYAVAGSVGRTFEDFPNPVDWAMTMEVPSLHAVHWMSPHDADEALLEKLNEDSEFAHDGRFVVGFMDGHVISVSAYEWETFRENLPKLTGEVRESL